MRLDTTRDLVDFGHRVLALGHAQRSSVDRLEASPVLRCSAMRSVNPTTSTQSPGAEGSMGDWR